jgi:hypothetical protein
MTEAEMRRWAMEQAVKVAKGPHEVLLLATEIYRWASVGAAPTREMPGLRSAPGPVTWGAGCTVQPDELEDVRRGVHAMFDAYRVG